MVRGFVQRPTKPKVLIMSPLYRGRDILVNFSLLICMSVSVVSVRSLHLSCRRSNTRRWPNVGLLLAHRLWRWANTSPVLGYRVAECGPASQTAGQHKPRPNVAALLYMSLKVYSLKESQSRQSQRVFVVWTSGIGVGYAELDGRLDPLISRG